MYQPHQLKAMSAQLSAGAPLAGVVVPAPKPRRRNLESECQRALIRWWARACKGFGVPECLLFSVPNGGGGGELRGHWLKLEGLRKGAPDLVLCVPRPKRITVKDGWYDEWTYAMFLELKTPTGRLSPEQKEFHAALRSRGYRVEVIRTLEEGIKTISEYLQ